MAQQVTRRLANVKKAEEVVLDGISVELTLRDPGSVQALVLRDGSGHELVITQEGYSLAVQVPAPPKQVDAFLLSGTVPGIRQVEEYFQYEHEAQARQRELDEVLRVDHEFTIRKVRVAEELLEASIARRDEVPF